MSTEGRHGARVLVTRAAEQAAELAALLRGAGYEPVVAPTVTVEPLASLGALDAALDDLGAYRWVILASANAAQLVAGRLPAIRGRDGAAGTELVTGPAGVRALEEAGLRVGRVVSPFSAAAVLDALAGERVDGARVLLPRSEGGREELAAGLRTRGAVVDEVAVYRTVPVGESEEVMRALREGVAAATFFSPSAVRGFLAALRSGGTDAGKALEGVVVACLGATTAGEARAHGLRVDVVPGDTTAAAMVEALVLGLANAVAVRREMAWLT